MRRAGSWLPAGVAGTGRPTDWVRRLAGEAPSATSAVDPMTLDPVSRALVATMGGDKARASATNPPSRWAMAVPAFLTHLSIGIPYAWSIMSGPLSRELGVVTSAAADWSMPQATMPISIVLAVHGLSAAAAGKWQAKVGPRAAIAVGGTLMGSGLALTAYGIQAHEIWAVYGGYGLLCGLGLGTAYTPPVQVRGMQLGPVTRMVVTHRTIAHQCVTDPDRLVPRPQGHRVRHHHCGLWLRRARFHSHRDRTDEALPASTGVCGARARDRHYSRRRPHVCAWGG